MLNNNELVSLVVAYGISNINDTTISADAFAQYLTDLIIKHNVSAEDMIAGCNRFFQTSASDERLISIINAFGTKNFSIKKDLFQPLANYYFVKGNIKKLTELITTYNNQYGEDEHTLMANINIMLMDHKMEYSIVDMKALVDKASKYLN